MNKNLILTLAVLHYSSACYTNTSICLYNIPIEVIMQNGNKQAFIRERITPCKPIFDCKALSNVKAVQLYYNHHADGDRTFRRRTFRRRTFRR